MLTAELEERCCHCVVIDLRVSAADGPLTNEMSGVRHQEFDDVMADRLDAHLMEAISSRQACSQSAFRRDAEVSREKFHRGILEHGQAGGTHGHMLLLCRTYSVDIHMCHHL